MPLKMFVHFLLLCFLEYGANKGPLFGFVSGFIGRNESADRLAVRLITKRTPLAGWNSNEPEYTPQSRTDVTI